MRIPDAILKSVVFIGIEDEAESSPKPVGTSLPKIKFCGTGFLVSVIYPQRLPNLPSAGYLYLVTAKHVIIGINGREHFIRANKKDGESFIFKAEPRFRWFYHPKEDESSDVAVAQLVVPEEVINLIDYQAIDQSLLLTDDKVKEDQIGVGDEVFIVGLFSFLTGSSKNIPIVRIGNIAMMPDEPVQTKSFGNMEAYLIEARSIGGMSGSPVFVLKELNNGKWRIHLLGLIHGHWDIGSEKILETVSLAGANKSSVNLGIAIVAPAKKILETIHCKELADIRAKYNAT